MAEGRPLIGIIMGSRSDWETMRHAAETLTALGERIDAWRAKQTADVAIDPE